MYYLPTTQILALAAQRRSFDGVRLDGPVQSDRPIGTVRVALAGALVRAARTIAPAARAPRRVLA